MFAAVTMMTGRLRVVNGIDNQFYLGLLQMSIFKRLICNSPLLFAGWFTIDGRVYASLYFPICIVKAGFTECDKKLFVDYDCSVVEADILFFKSAYSKSIKRTTRGINAKKMARPEKNRHRAAEATPPRVKNSSILLWTDRRRR